MHTYSLHMSSYYPKSSSFKRDTRESGTIVSILMVRCFRILWKHIVVPDMNWGQAYILITLLGVPVPFQFQLILFWSGFIYLLLKAVYCGTGRFSERVQCWYSWEDSFLNQRLPNLLTKNLPQRRVLVCRFYDTLNCFVNTAGKRVCESFFSGPNAMCRRMVQLPVKRNPSTFLVGFQTAN